MNKASPSAIEAEHTATVHLTPNGVALGPVELSIVVPALNEEITVGEFIDWCKEGIGRAGVTGQILIVDSSTDRTPEIVVEHGGEVLRTPKRGLGRAYIDAIPYIRGKWIIMGDADLTYDFRELTPFVEKFRRGAEFIMGSRFKGTIASDAMPRLHRYFGTPATTWLLNLIYGSNFSDIHCGMRGVTLDGLKRMQLKSQSWQYASEMIIKSLHLKLRTAEVPITFHKDREGRVSHLKRVGWHGAWYAGWITVQIMLTYGADFFLLKPGMALLLVGALGSAMLFNGPVQFVGIGFSLHWMLLFLVAFLVGLQLCFTGILAKAVYDSEQTSARMWQRFFGFNRAVLISALLFVAGLSCAWGLLAEYFNQHFQLPAFVGVASYRAVAGVGFILSAFLYFTFSLVFNALLETRSASNRP